MKTRPAVDNTGEIWGYEIKCPACRSFHVIHTNTNTVPARPTWQFNGNVDKPTFTPSLKLHYEANENMHKFCCHSVITDGMIAYCADCTHDYAGKTVELPDLEIATINESSCP